MLDKHQKRTPANNLIKGNETNRNEMKQNQEKQQKQNNNKKTKRVSAADRSTLMATSKVID